MRDTRHVAARPSLWTENPAKCITWGSWRCGYLLRMGQGDWATTDSAGENSMIIGRMWTCRFQCVQLARFSLLFRSLSAIQWFNLTRMINFALHREPWNVVVILMIAATDNQLKALQTWVVQQSCNSIAQNGYFLCTVGDACCITKCQWHSIFGKDFAEEMMSLTQMLFTGQQQTSSERPAQRF